MPPGSPHHAQKNRLPTWVIVLLVIVGIGVAGVGTCVVIGGAAVYWVSNNAESWQQAAEQAGADGFEYGRDKSDLDCQRRVLELHGACGQLDIACINSVNGFAAGCYASATLSPDFCRAYDESGSAEFSISDAMAAHQRECERLGQHFPALDDAQCGVIFNSINLFCATEPEPDPAPGLQNVAADEIPPAQVVEP